MANSSGDVSRAIGQASLIAEDTHFLTQFGYGVVQKAIEMDVSDESVLKEMDYDDLKMLTIHMPTLSRLRKYYKSLHDNYNNEGYEPPIKRHKLESTPHAKAKLFDTESLIINSPMAGQSTGVKSLNAYDEADLTPLSFFMSPTVKMNEDKSTSVVIRTPLEKFDQDRIATQDTFPFDDDKENQVTGPSSCLKPSSVGDSDANEVPRRSTADDIPAPSPTWPKKIHVGYDSINKFCKQLDLSTEKALRPIVGDEELIALQSLTRNETMPSKSRAKILRCYAAHVHYYYHKEFQTHYVDKNVKSFMAKKLIVLFPSLGDKSNTQTGHETLFTEHPRQQGFLFTTFKTLVYSKKLNPTEMARPKRRETNTKKNNQELLDTEQYDIKLRALKSSSVYTLIEKDLMVETFNNRRRWIKTGKEMSVQRVLEEYPIFATRHIEIHEEFRRMFPSYNEEDSLRRLRQWLKDVNTKDDMTKVVRGVSRRAVVGDIVIDKNPETVAQSTGRIIICIWSGSISVAIPGGFCVAREDVSQALLLVLKLCYITSWNYEPSVRAVYGVVEGLAGLDVTVNLATQARQVLDLFKD